MLKRGKRKEQEVESALNKRRHWFQAFLPRSGERLDRKDIEEIARVTKGWDLSVSQVNVLLASSTLWASCPGLFRVIRSCYRE